MLNGPYTFFLANAFILTVPFWQLQDRRSRRLTWLGALLLVFVVLLNRRTAWLAIIVGLAVMMVRNRRLSRRVLALVVGAVVLTIAGYVALGGSKSEEQIVATSAVGTGTLDWRIQGWSELLAGLSTDPVQWGIGEPLGSDFTREVQGSEVEAEPHNFYLSHLLRAGVVGLLALIALTGGLFRALWRIPPPGGRDGLLAPGVFPALLAMQIVWFLAWTPGMEQGIITGLAVGLAACSRGGVQGSPGAPAEPRLRSSRSELWPVHIRQKCQNPGGRRSPVPRVPSARGPASAGRLETGASLRGRQAMRLNRPARPQASTLLWVGQNDGPPHPYLVAACARGRRVWFASCTGVMPQDGRATAWPGDRGVRRPDGPGAPDERQAGQPADAPRVRPRPRGRPGHYELGLVGLYAGLSKLFRPHKVISLVEGDYRHIGRTGNAFVKVVVRRLAARFVDVFVANNPSAREYLIRTLHVPEEKIIVGWWLAGMPADLAARPPAAAPAAEGVPLFVCAGRLIPQKGTDLLIRAAGSLPTAVRPLRPVDHRRRPANGSP